MAYTITGPLKNSYGDLVNGDVLIAPYPARSGKIVSGSVITGQARSVAFTAGEPVAALKLENGTYTVHAPLTDDFRIAVPAGTGTAALAALVTTGVVNPTSIETGLPSGGTTGQVLAKQSGDDFDADWDDATASAAWGGISGTLADQTDLQTALDAAGSFQGSFTVAGLPAGSLGHTAYATDAISAADFKSAGAFVLYDGSAWRYLSHPTVSVQTELMPLVYAMYESGDLRTSTSQGRTILNFLDAGYTVANYSGSVAYDWSNLLPGTARTNALEVRNAAGSIGLTVGPNRNEATSNISRSIPFASEEILLADVELLKSSEDGSYLFVMMANSFSTGFGSEQCMAELFGNLYGLAPGGNVFVNVVNNASTSGFVGGFEELPSPARMQSGDRWTVALRIPSQGVDCEIWKDASKIFTQTGDIDCGSRTWYAGLRFENVSSGSTEGIRIHNLTTISIL